MNIERRDPRRAHRLSPKLMASIHAILQIVRHGYPVQATLDLAVCARLVRPTRFIVP
jgi:hypothetical protein